MAKLTLDTITSSFASTTLFNTNFATILAELDGKVLYRNNTSGEANQMENDLDMNSNSILNAVIPAASMTYDNTTSGLTATTVQAAIDELAALHP
jgi:hypothetical protein